MEYHLIKSLSPITNECIVLGLFEGCRPTALLQGLPKNLHALVQNLWPKLAEAGDWIWQAEIDGHALMLVHCGKEEDFNNYSLSKRLSAAASALTKNHIKNATLCFPLVHEKTADWQLEYMLPQLDALFYQQLEFKTKKNKAHQLTDLSLYLPSATEETLITAKAIAAGVHFTRKLADRPANHCTPTYLGQQAEDLARQYPSLHAKVLGLDEIKALKMGTFLAVSQGSVEPPCFIDIQHRGGGDAAPFILVGKGITFDSGGLSIKPAHAMDEMKYDMAGAACVLGVIQVCAMLNLPINVIGLIASAENMPSGTAIKPGDVVTSMSGQTVEILNTDAEGRLVLADALTYAEQYNPNWVIDIATLTGAMVVALGSIASGFMTKDDALAHLILRASDESGDTAWRMPIDERYQDVLDSPIADFINSAFDRTASAITAACFLSRFTEKYRWAHLDIAGTAWVSGDKRHATGRPVPLLVEVLREAARAR